ncbi:MAG: MMPL family transporter [Gemmatimonadetes bacterium]|nr:MMPL family transporter [Gemmatimonadota bacterium]
MIPLPANYIVRWRWPIVVAWATFAALMVPVARGVHQRLQVGGQNLPNSESTRAEDIVRDRIGTPYANFAAVVIRHDSLTLDDPRYASYVESLTTALDRLPFVVQTLSWRRSGDAQFRSDDGKTTLVLAGLRQHSDNDHTSYVPLLRESVRKAQAATAPGFEAHVTGGPAFDYDTRTIAAEDSASLERHLIPLTWLLLVIAFGALVAALVPVAVGFIAITVTLGVIAVLAAFTPISIFVLNITTMMGLGVGIDYSLLVLTRFREELDSGADPATAAVTTIRTASAAVITSGATVMVGLLALLIVPLAETRSVGLGGLIVVATSVALSISFLPAILAILGRRIDWPKGLASNLARFRSEVGWNRYALGISKHPMRAAIISGVVIAVLAAPTYWLRIGLPVSGWFPQDTEAGVGLRLLERMGQGAALQPIKVVVNMEDGSAVLDGDRLRGLKALTDSIRANPRVAQVRGVVDLRPGIPLWQYAVMYADEARARERYAEVFKAFVSHDGSATAVDVVLSDTVTLDGSLDAVRDIRRIAIRGLPTLQRAELLVGGFSASSLDFRNELLRRFPLLVVLVLGATGVMLAVVFRSLLVPIKAVIMNSLSVAAAFGLTVVLFQWGVGGWLIGLEGPTEAIFVLGPVLVFAIVFGLSMDYEVFLLARIKEEFDESHDNDAATTAGLAATGATITSAALIMILVFGAFAFARVLAVKLIGFGLAVAVLLDATVIRMVMVPAVMHLAGRFNWWPGYRRRGAGGHYRRASGGVADAETGGDTH